MARYLALPALALLVGAAAGYAAGRHEAGSVKERLDAQASELAALTKTVRGVKATCERTKIVNVAAAAAAVSAKPWLGPPPSLPAAAAADEEPAPSDEELEAEQHYLDGEELLGDALQAGTWTEQDAERLRALSASLSLEQRSALLEQLAQGFNAGKLRYDGDGSPF